MYAILCFLDTLSNGIIVQPITSPIKKLKIYKNAYKVLIRTYVMCRYLINIIYSV